MHRFLFVTAACLAIGWAPTLGNGPHGGALYVGAERKFYAELQLGLIKNTAIVIILDKNAENAVAIPAKTIEMRIKGIDQPLVLPALPSKGDSKLCSTFAGVDDRLAGKPRFTNIEFRIAVDNSDKIYTFTYEE